MLLVRLLHPTKHLVSGVTAAVLAACALYCQNATDLLAQARKLYDQGDRYRAAPLFARAEQQFRLAHDRRNEFAAKFGRLHSDADHGNYKAVKAEIETDLKSPTVQADPQLKIQALALLGIIDLNIDTVAAGSDWKQVLETATAAGDKKWQNRARGELAIVAGLNGNIAAAGAGLLKAIAVAEQIGDTGGAINFRIWLANGMTVNGMADSALKQLDKATELATHSGYRQLPFQLSIARLRAIAMLPEPARAEHLPEAQNLFRSTLQQAQAEHVYGAQIELWNQQGQLALGSEKLTLAEKSLLEAWSVARQAGLAGLGAEADLHLAQLYLQMRQPRKAEASIKRGMQEIAGAEEGYDFPLFVAAEADVQAALRHAKRADALYQHATTLLEGLLVNAPSSQVKSSMVNAFSRIYVSHFRLVWAQEHDAAKALQIIENARARVLLDSMLYTRRVHTVAAESPEEIKIAQLQRKLIRQKVSESEAKQILRQLDEAYDQLGEANAAQERKEAAFLRHPPAVLPVVRNLLGEREVLLEYVLARDASYCLELSRSGLQVHQLPDRGQITRMTRAYLGALKSNRDGVPTRGRCIPH